MTEVPVVIWTTTPWTIPGNRAIAFLAEIAYGLYRVTGAPEDNWAKVGATYILADKLAESVFRRRQESADDLSPRRGRSRRAGSMSSARIRFTGIGYAFDVPLLPGDHVTDDAGTGFVHTAPGHGREDFEIWTRGDAAASRRGIDPRIPYTVDENGAFTDEAPGFEGKRVITDKGEKGDANEAVIKALIEAGALIARGRLKHQYPHSWRSKKPVIFRNTPQWFIAMDRADSPTRKARETLRGHCALAAIKATRWVPASGENRINGMVSNKPDWVMSRQRAWGVPLSIFVRKSGHEILFDEEVNARIADAYEQEGADAWYRRGREGALPRREAQCRRIRQDRRSRRSLVRFRLDARFHARGPAPFPGLAGIRRAVDGGADEVMYLEGSDQHRGWFQSSLLESCGTRGRAPFDIVLTHGFTLDEKGRKMSKSLGNQTFPQDVIKQSGADILRLWVASVDYSDDQRIGPEILKSGQRQLSQAAQHDPLDAGHARALLAAETTVGLARSGELERLMLHRSPNSTRKVREAYANFDYARVIAALSAFMNADLSAFYFDIRKDALYCEAPSSASAAARLETIEHIFRA